MKHFCERVTCTLQVPARIVELNLQKDPKDCTCTGTCRVHVQVRMLNLSIIKLICVRVDTSTSKSTRTGKQSQNLYYILTCWYNDNGM